MKRQEVFQSNWLQAADLGDGDLVVTIKEVTMETLKDQQTKQDVQKPVVHFVEDLKPMVLNVTNWKQIEKATNCEDTDEWQGKKIILFAMEVEAFGEMKMAIRVRSHAPKKPALPQGKPAPNSPAAPNRGPVRPTSEQAAADAAAEEETPF
jgi:hypothetical protein